VRPDKFFAVDYTTVARFHTFLSADSTQHNCCWRFATGQLKSFDFHQAALD